MGDFIRRLPQATLEQFHAFRDERPKEEKWELIDGVPTMMPPPSLVHQRISSNLQQLLNARLVQAKPGWRADMEIGILLPEDTRFNPEPDVTVIDAYVELGKVYADHFYFVAEVLSNSDKPIVLDLNTSYYKTHQSCLGVILVRQDRIEADLHVRDGETDWTIQKLETGAERIVIPVIGDIGPLKDLYRWTPLYQR